jgi:chemotaxis protein methyltransferase CheR
MALQITRGEALIFTGHDTEALELHLLVEGIYQQYGYDFREYSPALLRRRVDECVQKERVNTISGFQEKVLHDPLCLERFIQVMSARANVMFGNPAFYPAFRQKAAPELRELPFIRVWQASCSTGEEVYSLAILLLELGLYDRCRIYATDFNGVVVQRAKAGIFPRRTIKTYAANYRKGGGQAAFSDYYTVRGENILMDPELQKNIVFAQHNLITDASFNEFHVILCQNVLVHFNGALRGRVHHLLYGSLAACGILGLGSDDSLQFTPHETDYELVDAPAYLYRKVR